MLIYVDKKKEKRRKIKICSLIILGCLFLFANFSHFKYALYHNNQNLTDYHSIKHFNNWFAKTDTLYLFKSHTENHPKVIIVPQNFNKETALILAKTLLKHTQKEDIASFSPELDSNKKLKKLVHYFLPNQNGTPNIMLTTDFFSAKEIIYREKLYPLTINYKQTEKTEAPDELYHLLDSIFPPHPSPQNTLEKEKASLQTFARDNQANLISYVKTPDEAIYSLENIFLQNIRLCAETENKTFCQTDINTSLEQNLIKILKKTKKHPLKKLILLTSDTKLSPLNIKLAADEGIHFCYHNLETFLLPNEIKKLANNKNIIYILKQRAGINPEYNNQSMKFFKFKIVEILLDDNI